MSNRARSAVVSVVAASIVATQSVPAGGHAPHRVQAGESLSVIAARHGTTVPALVRANRLRDPDRIIAGTVLRMRARPATRPAGPVRRTRFHVVRSGETLSEIAARYGVAVRTVARANGIRNPALIIAGRRLRVPNARAPQRRPAPTRRAAPRPAPRRAAPAPGGRTYTVRPGDTLSGIAARHRVAVRALSRLNGITDPNRIYVGTVLRIPGRAGWRCPVAAPNRFVDDFGVPKYDRSGRIVRYHQGVDIFAAHGAPVVAPVSGYVWRAVGSIGGYQVTLVGTDRYRYLASHLSRFGASGRVSAGQVIGYVGTSGNARGTSPHVHFEMHRKGAARASNPYTRLRKAC